MEERMLDFMFRRVLLKLASAYNIEGMPDFVRNQIVDIAEQFIENNELLFEVIITTAGRMRIASTVDTTPDDNFSSVDEGTLNAYIASVVILDLVD